MEAVGEDSMRSQTAQLMLHIDAGSEADDEERAQLARRLRKDLLELDVESADLVRAGEAPAGAKGLPVDWATLAVSVTPAVLTALFSTLQSWLTRHDRASVTVESGTDKIVVTGTPSQKDQELIRAFINRHKESTAAAGGA